MGIGNSGQGFLLIVWQRVQYREIGGQSMNENSVVSSAWVDSRSRVEKRECSALIELWRAKERPKSGAEIL